MGTRALHVDVAACGCDITDGQSRWTTSGVAGAGIANQPSCFEPVPVLAAAIASLMAKKTALAQINGGSPTTLLPRKPEGLGA